MLKIFFRKMQEFLFQPEYLYANRKLTEEEMEDWADRQW